MIDTKRLTARLMSGLILVALAVGVSACRESEQGRPLTYEKGTYQGKQDHPLTDAELAELRERAVLQATGIGVGAPHVGGGSNGPGNGPHR